MKKSTFTVPAFVRVTTTSLDQYAAGEIEELSSWAITLHDGQVPEDYYPGSTYIPLAPLVIEIPPADIRLQTEVIAVRAELARENARFAERVARLNDRLTELTAITHQPEEDSDK